MISRYGLTAAFLLFIYGMAVWNLPEAKAAAENSQEKTWAAVSGSLEQYYSEELKGRYRFVEGNGLAKRLAFLRTCNDTVRLDNGDLERLSNHFDWEDTADSLIKLSEYCRKLEIPFLCVFAPSKVCQYDTGLPLGVPDEVNPAANQVIERLENAEVSVLDLRRNLHEEGRSHEELFFHTDHHWNSEGAFWGYQKLTERLNADFGYEIDDTLRERENFCQKDFPEGFLGSYGKRTGKYFGGVDDISVILPDFEVSLRMEVPDRGIVREGDFSQALLDFSQITDAWYYDDSHIPYAVYTGDDYNLMRIINENAENDKKLLLLKDSFVRPVASFLSLGIRQVEAIDLRIEPKISVKEYLNAHKPDTVVFMCSIWALKDYNLIDFGL
jgi:hypothetical protein